MQSLPDRPTGGMQSLPGRPASFWVDTAPGEPFPSLERDLSFDVAVLGAGITGVTTALLLKREGLKVALVEAARVAHGASGYSTAKVTSQHSLTYSKLHSRFGDDGARAYGAANQAGLALIVRLSEELGIDCDLRRKPAFAYTESDDERDTVRQEAEDALACGLPASYTEALDLPWPVAGAVRFDDQAEFHPVKYLVPLAREVDGDGSAVFEGVRAVGVKDGEQPRVTMENGRTITARHVVVATHAPFLDRGGFFARMHAERSYVLGVKVRGSVPQGMYISTQGHSLRAQPVAEGELLLVGGESHKLGHAHEGERYRALETYARERFDVASIDWRWATHDHIPHDQVPYVGRLAPFSKKILVATGFRKWGYANAGAAALMLTDRISGRPNLWAATFDSTRLGPPQAAYPFVKENANVGRRFVVDRLKRADPGSIAPGEGAIVRDGLRQLAVHRDDEGRLHAVSARCTHLGCIVDWNGAERSWDCPCHGSRFAADGSVLAGPAVAPLERRSVADD